VEIAAAASCMGTQPHQALESKKIKSLLKLQLKFFLMNYFQVVCAGNAGTIERKNFPFSLQ
jgi:hypothetical protein